MAELQTPLIEPPTSQASDNKKILETLIRETTVYAWGVAIAVFYLCGFLVINAFLAKFGISDFEFVSTRYLLAAANFAFFLVCFGLFAGRAVVQTPTWLREELEWINRTKPSNFWSGVVFLNSLINMTFMICMSAAFYTSAALWQTETVFFYLYLGLTFGLSYGVDVLNFDVRYIRTTEIFKLLVRSGAIVVFFLSPNNNNLTGMFWLFVGIVFYINFVFDSFNRYKITKDRIFFSALYSMVFLLLTSLAFGATYFGQISSKLGGGRGQETLLTLAESIRTTLPKLIHQEADQTLKAKVIYQTEKYLFADVAGQTLRLRSDDIVHMIILREVNTNPMAKVLETLGMKAPKPEHQSEIKK